MEMGDGWVILWRPEDRNEWEFWRAQEGGVTQVFVPGSQDGAASPSSPTGREDRLPCTICGDVEPFHVHDKERRIEGYFTVGRGMDEMDAARAWQAKCQAAEAQRDRLAETGTWLVRCLKDVNAAKPVRGLDEAITAWEAALSVLDRETPGE